MSETKSGYVYTLNDPRTGDPKYVGATVDPKQRFAAHMSDAPNDDVNEWIDQLREDGHYPVMSLVSVSSLDELSDQEQQIIQRLSEEWELLNADESFEYSPPGSGEDRNYRRPKVRDATADVLDSIAEANEYGSMDEAIVHALREAGYDV